MNNMNPFLILLLIVLGTFAYMYHDQIFPVDSISDVPPYQPQSSKSLLQPKRLSPDEQKRLEAVLGKNAFFPRESLDPGYRELLEKLEAGHHLTPEEGIKLSRYNPRLSGLNKDLDEYCILNFGGRQPLDVIHALQKKAREEDDETSKQFLERFFIAY